MGKVIVNSKEVVPARKVKLFKILSRTDISALVKEKQDEQRRERQRSNQG